MFIRPANESDISDIKRLMDRNFDDVISRYHSLAVVDKFKEHNSVESLQVQLNWKKIYVAVIEGTIGGTGAFANFGTEEVPIYSVSNLFILPELHGKGIGGQILDVLINEARDNDASTFHVPSSRNAVNFYAKYGFRVDDLQPDENDEITWMTLVIS